MIGYISLSPVTQAELQLNENGEQHVMSDVLTEANRENIKAKAIALHEMMCIYRDAGFTEKQAFEIVLLTAKAPAQPQVQRRILPSGKTQQHSTASAFLEALTAAAAEHQKTTDV